MPIRSLARLFVVSFIAACTGEPPVTASTDSTALPESRPSDSGGETGTETGTGNETGTETGGPPEPSRCVWSSNADVLESAHDDSTLSADAGYLLPQDEAGWSIVTPAEDSHIVYLSTSGSDEANCAYLPSEIVGSLESPTSTTRGALTPCRTLAKGKSLLRYASPDWLLLARGETWTIVGDENLNWLSTVIATTPTGDYYRPLAGRSFSEPMVLGAYGASGPRPIVQSEGGGFGANALPGYQSEFLVVKDLHFKGIAHEGEGGNSTAFDFLNAWSYVLLEGNRIERFTCGICVQSLEDTQPRLHWSIRRNVVVDNYSWDGLSGGGILTGSTFLLFEDNVFDHNGWVVDPPRGPYSQSHNTYFHASDYDDPVPVTARGNIIARASETGLSLRGGGIADDNLMLQNPIGLGFGHGQNGVPTIEGTIKNNVILDAKDTAWPIAWSLALSWNGQTDAFCNVVAHLRSSTGNNVGPSVGDGAQNIAFHDNVVYDWSLSTKPTGGAAGYRVAAGQVSGMSVEDNFFWMPNDLAIDLSGDVSAISAYAFHGNHYWSERAEPFATASGFMGYDTWLAYAGEGGSTFADIPFVDPERDMATYLTSLGLGTYPFGSQEGLEAFLDLARAQDRWSWDDRITASAAADYVREGFRLVE